MDLEAAAGAVQGGLMAGAVERPGGHAGEHSPLCADCGTQTLGRFCHNCGNPAHVHRTLLHLGEELLHGVMHFDSRAWRTLPMLVFRPGRLTRDWVMGKRARYVSPLAMFLFTVFVIFMALSYLPTPEARTTPLSAPERAALQKEIDRAEAKLAASPAAERPLAKAALEAARSRAEADETRVINVDGLPQALEKLRAEGAKGVNTGNPELDAKIRHKLENPELAIYKLQQTFYKFSFLLIPISIPFVALLFIGKKGVTLYDHGVFVLYSLTFMSTLVLVVTLSARLGGHVASFVGPAFPVIAPAHMFFQLKGAYELKVWSALWRTLILLFFCILAMACFVLAVLWLGLT